MPIIKGTSNYRRFPILSLLGLLIILFFALTARWALALGSTPYEFEWAYVTAEAQELAEVWGVSTDAAGNIYVTGYFEGTVDFDPGSGVYELTSEGSEDSYIQKLDSQGNLLWVAQIGGPEQESGLRLSVYDNKIYLITTYSASTDFDPGPGYYYLDYDRNLGNVVLAQFTTEGEFKWAIPNVDNRGLISPTLDAYGNAVVMRSRGEIAKVGVDGELTWQLTLLPPDAPPNYSSVYSVATDRSGKMYVIGTFRGTLDFDPSSAVYEETSSCWNGFSSFILKLDEQGGFQWVKTFENHCDDDYSGALLVTGLGIDNLGNLYVGGKSNRTDLDPGPGVFGANREVTSGFVVKLDSSGNFVWGAEVSPGDDCTLGCWGAGVDDLTLDNQGNVLAIGGAFTEADIDPGPESLLVQPYAPWTSRGFYISLDPDDGSLIWGTGTEGQMNEAPLDIDVDVFDNLVIGGSFKGVGDFDPGPSIYELSANPGYYAGYTMKLRPSAVSPDQDGDGIYNEVDTLPSEHSDDFTDTLADGGSSFGSIIQRGDQMLVIANEPSPDGIRLSAANGEGMIPARVNACGAAIITLTPGDEVVITCGSVTAKTYAGPVEIELIPNAGLSLFASLASGYGITFYPESGMVVALASNPSSLSISVDGRSFSLVPAASVRSVSIDIKPGSYPNCVNLNNHGVIPVAIFSTTDFAASTIDPLTVRLDGRSVRVVGKGNLQAHLSDLNGDGLDDLIVQIEDSDSVLREGTTTAILTGSTFQGHLVVGTDSICVVP